MTPSEIAELLEARPTGDGKWSARCPAHDDRHASLSIATGESGKTLLRCFAGCTTQDIVAARGLSMGDLFPLRDDAPRSAKTTPPKSPTYATMEAALQALDAQNGTPAGRWQYRDAAGDVVGVVTRFNRPDGKFFRPASRNCTGWLLCGMPTPRPLYRLPEVMRSTGIVFVSEGEKACDAGASIGLTTTTSAHGAQSPGQTSWQPLAGRDVVILPDNDDPGRKYAADVRKLLEALDPPARIRVLELPGLPPKGDLFDLVERRTEDGKDASEIRAEITALLEAMPPTDTPADDDLPILTFAELVKAHPDLRPPLIDGILRAGEVMNIIAAPKIGKSWSTIGLAYAVATGQPWFGVFPTSPGNILIIDNELHPETTAHRLRRVADAAGIHHDLLAQSVSVLNLRGRLRDLRNLGVSLKKLGRDRFTLVILDALYRAMPAGTEENANGDMTNLYNLLDHYADAMGAAFALVHHATKGDQSSKGVTDVGAGAGAQSRATDTHLVLRPHEEDDVVVLDAAVRSFPPVSPICLRWQFPLWSHDPSLDPSLLRVPKPRKRRPEGEEPEAKEPPWDARRFADAFGRDEPRTRSAILDEARILKLSDRKAEMLLKAAIDREYLFAWKLGGANTPTMVSRRRKG